MRIKLIVTNEGKRVGFLEYIPGPYTWRVVDAPRHFVIHCIWVNARRFPTRGLGSALLENCVADAKANGMDGVAVVTSDGPWMASKDVFINNGFVPVDEAAPHFQLLVMQTGSSRTPVFPRNWDERLKQFRDLRLLYTNQCPYIGKAIEALPPVAARFGIPLHLVEMRNAAETRERMPSPYGVISLVYNGRLLADHPISATRFANILRRDLQLKSKDGS